MIFKLMDYLILYDRSLLELVVFLILYSLVLFC